MTFTFTCDAFPAYTKFDKTHKVFAAIDIVGDENIHPDDPENLKIIECPEPEVHFEKVEAGWTAFSDNPEDLTGYYYPMRLTVEPNSKIIMTTHDGGTKSCTVEDGVFEIVKAIRPEAPVYTVILEDPNGEQQEYSFDFSKVVFK